VALPRQKRLPRKKRLECLRERMSYLKSKIEECYHDDKRLPYLNDEYDALRWAEELMEKKDENTPES
jgi:hypothetical protein